MSSAPTAEHAAYAEQVFYHSARIVGAVHDEGPEAVQEAIDQAMALPAPPGVDPVHALVTLLAAQVNPEATASDRVGWIASSDRIRARVLGRTPADPDPTLTELDARLTRVLDRLAPDIEQDEVEKEADVAVLAAIAGQIQLLALPYAHRLVAVEILRRRGHGVKESATRLRCNPKTIARHRRAYTEARRAAMAAAPTERAAG